MNNRDRLIEIISENNLERRRVAELLRVNQLQVDHWILPNDAKNHVDMPDMAIELLELKLSMMPADESDSA